jgi:hypothetical protein
MDVSFDVDMCTKLQFVWFIPTSVNPVHNALGVLPPPPPPRASPGFPFPHPKTLHKERAVTGRIFEALST